MASKNAVPNIFTFANLACGVLSLLMTFNSNYRWACLFIIIAGLIDRYDGRVARFLQVSSEIGKELDSLADLVSFGVAPSILVFNLYNFVNLGLAGYLLVLVFPIAGAYRLARYNTASQICKSKDIRYCILCCHKITPKNFYEIDNCVICCLKQLCGCIFQNKITHKLIQYIITYFQRLFNYKIMFYK
jgi:CDP-diacylglycerol--serine O-phosphatidyltransferase